MRQEAHREIAIEIYKELVQIYTKGDGSPSGKDKVGVNVNSQHSCERPIRLAKMLKSEKINAVTWREPWVLVA